MKFGHGLTFDHTSSFLGGKRGGGFTLYPSPSLNTSIYKVKCDGNMEQPAKVYKFHCDGIMKKNSKMREDEECDCENAHST